MPEKSYKKKHMTSFQLIIMGFAGVILFGNRSADASIFFCGEGDHTIS